MTTANYREADGVSVSTSSEQEELFYAQLEKFKKEYERLRLISNVHVVKVYDCFEENGTAYYVMEFVMGANLEDYLNKKRSPYAETTVRNYLKQILDGLNAIHSKGLLHLDIKPSNIMKTSRGYLKLIDLGASKDYIQGVGATFFSGVALTNRYAPPEQVDGSYDKLGPWTDFYALGATVYHLLTCNVVPTWTNISDDKSKDKHIALSMPGISEEMKSLVVWMMNTDRAKRPQSVKEILKRLKSKPSQHLTNLDDNEEITINSNGDAMFNHPQPTYLEVSKTILFFDAKESNESIAIEANADWNVSCAAPWVNLTQTNSSICVRVDANYTIEKRNTQIFVKSSDLCRIIVLTQNGRKVPRANSPMLKAPPIIVTPKDTREAQNKDNTNPAIGESKKDEDFSPIGCFYIIVFLVVVIWIIKSIL